MELFELSVEARVAERTRMAREVHDTLLQSFQGLLLRFQTVSELLSTRPAGDKTVLARAIEQAASAITEGRKAVEGVVQPLHPMIRDEVYQIAGEALRNAFQHSQGTQMTVDLR